MSRTAMPGPHGLRASVRAARGLTSDPCPFLDELSATHGPTFTVAIGPTRLVVIGDPADLDQMFAVPSSDYRWGHILNVLGFIVGQTSMIVSDGEDHRRRRGGVQPGFARRRLDGWIPMIVDEADAAIDRTVAALQQHAGGQAGGDVDLYPIGKHLVLTVAVQSFFGSGLHERAPEIEANFDALQEYIELPGPKQIPHPFPRSTRSRARAAHQKMDQIVDDELARRRRQRDPEAIDVLDMLMDAGSDGERLTDEEIRDQVATLIGAGYHTTAASLAWTLQRALAEPGVWTRLRDEADRVLGDKMPDGVGAADLKQLTYASAVVHEALRLHPAGVFAPRQAAADVTIGAHTIRKGSMIMWSPYLAGRDPSVWTDPLAFRPDRHLETDLDPEVSAAREHAWVKFGRGPRRCIGFALAQMELVLILARMSQRLDLTATNTTVPAAHGVVVNRPVGGVPVTGRGRDHGDG